MLDENTKIVQKKYNRFSNFYDLLEIFFDGKKFKNWNRDLIHKKEGKILEVGVGTGKNLKFYDDKSKVIGIDISLKMLDKAKIILNELGKNNITLAQMDAQNLKFKDNSFDYVVCTFVLCSVPDPVKVLMEMKRVCKKNGKILMLEHMLSDYKLIAFLENLHNPIMKTLLGVNINRKTMDNIKKAGLKVEKTTNLAFFDVYKKIEIINFK